MNFYDIPEDAFPQGAQFFHHVTVVSITIADDVWNMDCDTVWYLERIMDPKPFALFCYQEERECLNADNLDILLMTGEASDLCDWALEYYEDCVIELDPDGTITCYGETDDYED